MWDDVECELALRRVGARTSVGAFRVDAGLATVLVTGGNADVDRWAAKSRPTLVMVHVPGAFLMSASVAAVREAVHDAPSVVRDAIQRALKAPDVPAVRVGEFSLNGQDGPVVMGVVNVTPDSFSDGGQFFDVAAAVAHGVAMAGAGARLLDVGGESTRPGAASVDEKEELRRVVPVIEALRRAVPLTTLSVDTSKANVARAAVAAGARLVNDVTALAGDARMAETVAETGVALCLMHMKGTPRTMQKNPTYDDVVAEVHASLSVSIGAALADGVARDRLLIDPGIGFGKSFGHNWALLKGLRHLRALGLPVVVGVSRKAFLGEATGRQAPSERVSASAGVAALLTQAATADVLRVHDVAQTVDAVKVALAYRQAREAGDAFRLS